ncbi:hypothetical protein J8N05_20010 [Streptomyces sp. BH-SS-21]|uniref:Uncharacterized protein n=1 Tax=Streptomyces liliiviolaceus TaxID=2823109 RepID=A0A941B839_9ACTN|nr:hypothetical protein [Streptomyces liliiviolaceus]
MSNLPRRSGRGVRLLEPAQELVPAGEELGEDTAGGAQEFGDVTTGQHVTHRGTLPDRDHDAGPPEDGQLLGEAGRLDVDVDVSEQVTDGHRPVLEQLQALHHQPGPIILAPPTMGVSALSRNVNGAATRTPHRFQPGRTCVES